MQSTCNICNLHSVEYDILNHLDIYVLCTIYMYAKFLSLKDRLRVCNFPITIITVSGFTSLWVGAQVFLLIAICNAAMEIQKAIASGDSQIRWKLLS